MCLKVNAERKASAECRVFEDGCAVWARRKRRIAAIVGRACGQAPHRRSHAQEDTKGMSHSPCCVCLFVSLKLCENVRSVYEKIVPCGKR